MSIKEINIKDIKEGVKNLVGNNNYLFQHLIATADIALYLAKKYKTSPKKAEIAALLHDCAKNLPKNSMREYIKKLKLADEIELKEPKLWHGSISAYLARVKFNIKDREVLSAIRYHTIGRPNMSLLAKIIYIADYLDLNKGYKDTDNIKLSAFDGDDIDYALFGVVTAKLKRLLDEKRPIHPAAIRLRNALLRKLKKLPSMNK